MIFSEASFWVYFLYWLLFYFISFILYYFLPSIYVGFNFSWLGFFGSSLKHLLIIIKIYLTFSVGIQEWHSWVPWLWGCYKAAVKMLVGAAIIFWGRNLLPCSLTWLLARVNLVLGCWAEGLILLVVGWRLPSILCHAHPSVGQLVSASFYSQVTKKR